MRHQRLCNLSVTFGEPGTVVLRAPTEGFAVRLPLAAMGLLAFCEEPRTEAEVVAALGEPARPLYRGLCDAGVLVPPERADATPHFYVTFESVDAHRRMLGDRPRMEAYQAAIREAVRPDMAVLDAGTGSGVLAMMAARAGARVVYAVDDSGFLDVAAEVVRRNGLADRVRLVQGDLAQVKLPEKVDLVVTETFGAMALVEGSPPDVAACCERNLAPGGRVIPEAIDLHLAPLASPEPVQALLGPFRDHPGLDFGLLEGLAAAQGVTAPIAASDLAHPGLPLGRLAYPGGGSELATTVRFPGLSGEVHGLVGWFDLHLGQGIVLGTGPQRPLTHWKQALLPLPRLVVAGDLEVDLHLEPAPDNRRAILVHGMLRTGGREHRFQHRVTGASLGHPACGSGQGGPR